MESIGVHQLDQKLKTQATTREHVHAHLFVMTQMYRMSCMLIGLNYAVRDA